MHLSTVKGAGVVVRQGTDARTLRNTASVYDLASAAIMAGHSLAAEVAARTQWPARPGQPQHAWEAPRVAKGVRDRSHRLKALGNAVSPPVAEAVGRWVMHWIEHEESRSA